MPDKLTQDDFVPGYSNTSYGDYPKLIYWTLETPIIYNGMNINANVLQRKLNEDSDWEFIPSVKTTSQEMGAGDYTYLMELDVEDIEITLDSEYSFDDAIDAVYATVDDIKMGYSNAKPRDYQAGDEDWSGWQDYGDQWDAAAAKQAEREEAARAAQRRRQAERSYSTGEQY